MTIKTTVTTNSMAAVFKLAIRFLSFLVLFLLFSSSSSFFFLDDFSEWILELDPLRTSPGVVVVPVGVVVGVFPPPPSPPPGAGGGGVVPPAPTMTVVVVVAASPLTVVSRVSSCELPLLSLPEVMVSGRALLLAF